MKQRKLIILIKILFLLLIVSCTTEEKLSDDMNEDVYVELPMEESEEDNIMVTDEGIMYLVHPSKIQSGGPPMDGIPSIDDPQYVTVEEADKWIEDNELVLAMIYKGEKRVYPLQILVWHEIVNDFIANDPILITYCPLCGSGIAYERTLGGDAVEFGTSGKLYNSNLVMYDRLTQSYWTQIDGLAIVGSLTGQKLTPLSIDTVVWRDWKEEHPDSEVLSQETGHSRNYGRDPYGDYYEDSFIFFPVENEDDRIHAKTVIFGIEVNGKYKAYKEDDLINQPTIKDIFNEVDIEITRENSGIIRLTNTKTGEEIIKERDFWFAWYAFHPDTQLYEQEENIGDIKMIKENLSKATFAGGCFWCMESDFEKLDGVKEVISGYTGGTKTDPTYEEVSAGTTGHRESIQIIYDPSIITYENLLETFWINVDPLDSEGQFCDKGFQYTSAIYYHNEEQKELAELSKIKVQELLDGDIATEIVNLDIFYTAEEYHQDYHDKHSIKYKTYRKLCGRDARLKDLWEDKQIEISENTYSNFTKPSDEELKETLTAIQYKVTQKDGTERSFDNEYWNNHEDGIYVDILSGEPLFSSTDKFDSGTGWPSFYKPLAPEHIVEKDDFKLLHKRTEIRSKYSDSHIGHIILDGPEWNDKIRYCMNSAALKFIPKEDLEKEGYEDYKDLFD